MRLIDADALWAELDNTGWYDNADRDEVALPILDAAPTIDAVLVVRCKDCKHSTLPSMQTQIYGKPNTLTCHNRKSPCNRRNVSSSDFCSYGESQRGEQITAAEARWIIHPDTTVEALAEIEYYGGFNGDVAKKAAVDEACLVACDALERRIPKKPYNLNTLADLSIGTCPSCGVSRNSEYPYCGNCGQALDWEVDDAQAGKD